MIGTAICSSYRQFSRLFTVQIRREGPHITALFEGKVAWVTGASSGIGEALSHELARRGASVVLSARREEVLRSVQSSCQHSAAHMALPLDMADTTAIPEAVARVLGRFGRIDILINNAGLTQRSLAVATTLEVDRQIMEVNFFGPVALTKAVLPSMLERGSGHLVVVSSLLGKFGIAQRSAYSASKHAVQGFFDSLRAEVHDRGVRITIACPGAVRTSASINALSGDGTRYGKMDAFLERGIPANDCAARILHAVERQRYEVYPAKFERLALLLSRFSPGLFNRCIRAKRLEQLPQ